MRFVITTAAVALLLTLTTGAQATSGFGCYRVNVGPADPLNVRSGPSASDAVVATISSADQPIIALSEGLERGENIQPSLFDVHQAEFMACRPSSLPLGARWCPVSLFDGSGPKHGWVKRRFVDHSECP